MAQTGLNEPRPLSPHLQVWRWHVTMLGSILHRATGFANYVGVALIVLWLFACAMGPGRYAQYEMVAAHPITQIILFGFTFSITYHLLNGLRHLFLDMGAGYKPSFASATAWVVLLLALVGSVAIWLLAGLVPGVSIGGGA